MIWNLLRQKITLPSAASRLTCSCRHPPKLRRGGRTSDVFPSNRLHPNHPNHRLRISHPNPLVSHHGYDIVDGTKTRRNANHQTLTERSGTIRRVTSPIPYHASHGIHTLIHPMNDSVAGCSKTNWNTLCEVSSTLPVIPEKVNANRREDNANHTYHGKQKISTMKYNIKKTYTVADKSGDHHMKFVVVTFLVFSLPNSVVESRCTGYSYNENCAALSMLCNGDCRVNNCVNSGCCSSPGGCDQNCNPPSCSYVVDREDDLPEIQLHLD